MILHRISVENWRKLREPVELGPFSDGVNVIHGGASSLRYTPHFGMTSAEVDLLVEHTRQALLKGPAKTLTSAAA